MILILDTNILLAFEMDDPWCVLLLDLFFDLHPTYVQLGFDAEGDIEKEYEEYKDLLSDDNQALIEKMILNPIKGFSTRLAPKVKSTFDKVQLAELTTLNCHPIEPAFLATSLADTTPQLVYWESGYEVIGREYWRQPTLNELKNRKLIGECISVRDAVSKLLRWHNRYPSTLAEMNALLDEYQIDGKREEHTFIECKCPQNVLTERMTRDIAKAVCAMLNTDGGWIFIGVRDSDKKAVGFKTQYENGAKTGFEIIQPIINQRINQIKPRPAGLFLPWAIDVGGGKVVVVIHVSKGEAGVNYCFDYREGKGWQVYVRQGPESVISGKVCTET